MNTEMHAATQEEPSSLKLVKSELKVFTTGYYETLNLMTVVGWSITDDAWIKYGELMANIENHLKNHDELTIYFKYELFNSSSIRYLFRIIRRFNRAHALSKIVKIYWSCSSESQREVSELGADFEQMADFKFKITNL